MTGAVEIWRGGVNTWECDEMGHMNVRFYVARFMEGLAGLAMRLGLPEAFSPQATATLLVRDHHLRFLREARAGAPLHMTGGVVELGETDALVLQVLIHTRTGEPCATALTRVSHCAPSGRDFPWPGRTRAAADILRVDVPAFAAPRSIDAGPVQPTASLEAADRLGVGCAGRGTIAPQDCDAFGRMRPEMFIGRVSDGVPRLREVLGDPRPQPAHVGGAVVEYRLIHLDWPHAGDRFEIRSGLVGISGNAQRIVHWMLDPASGRAWGSAEAVAVRLDLQARRMIPLDDDARELARAAIVPGLSL